MLQVRIRQLCAFGLLWYDTSNGRLKRGLRASDLPFWQSFGQRSLGQKPAMDRFQLERSARRRAYEWEVLAARARSDLGALRERARAALTERSSALPTGFKI